MNNEMPNNINDANNNQNNGFDVNSLNTIETLDDFDSESTSTVDNQVQAQEATTEAVASQPEIQPEQSQGFIKPVESTVQNTNQLLESVPKPDIMISSPSSNSVSTDDLLEEYIGKNYEKIKTRKFNLAAFFFTGAYFMYRKMFIEGIIVITVSLVGMYGLILINPLLAPIITLITAIASCLLFNKLYIKSSRKKIDAIKNKNRSKSVADLKSLCVRKGGSSLVVAIVVSALISIVVSAIFTTFFPLSLDDIMERIKLPVSNNNQSANNNNNGEPKNSAVEITYNESIILSELLDMGYLQIFTPTETNSDYSYEYERKTIPDNENSKCSFKLSVVSNYKSSVELISEMANYYNSSASVSTKQTPSGNTWNTFTVLDEGKDIYAAIENSGYVYLFKYHIDSEASDTAEVYYTGILNSIKFK